MRTPISMKDFHLLALMFVYDTDLMEMAQTPEEPESAVFARMQCLASNWAGALCTTGGALKPAKCFWHTLSFTWQRGKYKYKSEDAIKGVVTMPDPVGEPCTIRPLSPSKAKEVMGVWQAPGGNITQQLEELEGKITTWGNLIVNGYLHRRDIWRAFWGTIWRTISYALPVMTLTEPKGKGLLNGLYRKFLPALGVNRSLPRAYRHAPEQYFGLGLPDAYMEQTISQLEYLVMHMAADTLVGEGLRTSTEHQQLECGMGRFFLELPYQCYGSWTTFSWIQQLWQGLSELDTMVKCSRIMVPPLQRLNNAYLMDLFIAPGLSPAKLRRLNRLRIYLQVYCLSDIATGDGRRIR